MSGNKLQENTSGSLLPAVYYDMFAMRIAGAEYKQIAEQTGYSYSHVRTLFSKNGKIYDFWQKWVQEKKAENVQQALDTMFGHLPDVVKANITHALTIGKEGSVMARKILFDYTLGTPEQRVKLDARVAVGSLADWVKLKTQQNDRPDPQEVSKPAD